MECRYIYITPVSCFCQWIYTRFSNNTPQRPITKLVAKQCENAPMSTPSQCNFTGSGNLMLDSGWYHLGTLGLFPTWVQLQDSNAWKVFLRTQFSKLRVCFIQHWFSKHNIVKLNRKRWSCEVGAVHPSPSNQLVVHLSSRVSKYQFYQNQKHGPFMYCYIMILLLWTKSDFLWDIYI